MYFQNDGTFVKNNSYTLTDDFLNGKYKYTDFLNIIKDYRLKSEGNYDAMFGKVSNFSWSFDKNGTYNIILKLVSMGDVIESLKVNSLTSPTFLLNQEEQQFNTKNTSDIIWLYKDANTLGAWFYQQTESLIDAYNLEEAQKEIERTGESANIELEERDGIIIEKPKQRSDRNINPPVFSKEALDLLKEQAKQQKDSKKQGSIKDFVKVSFKPDKSDLKDQYYVRLGALLKFIQEGNKDLSPIIPKVKNKEGSVPLIYLDYDFFNLMSVDNKQVATDPRLCLVKKDISISNTEKISFNDDDESCADFEVIVNNVRYGCITNIYVNIVSIINVIKSNMDDKGKVDLYTFLKEILKNINLGLGGLNDLDLIINEENNTVVIVDNNPLPNRERFFNDKDITKFDLYGYKQTNATSSASFVKNFDFETEITNDLATMITAAVQYNGIIPGENPTALSKLNIGLTDRYKVTIASQISEGRDYEKDWNDFLEAVDEYNSYLVKLSNKEVTEKEVEANITKYKDILEVFDQIKNIKEIQRLASNSNQSQVQIIDPNERYLLPENSGNTNLDFQKIFENSSNYTGFIPFNLQLAIEGLSGIKCIQRFLIDGEYLPRNYPNAVEFLIRSEEHTSELQSH